MGNKLLGKWLYEVDDEDLVLWMVVESKEDLEDFLFWSLQNSDRVTLRHFFEGEHTKSTCQQGGPCPTKSHVPLSNTTTRRYIFDEEVYQWGKNYCDKNSNMESCVVR